MIRELTVFAIGGLTVLNACSPPTPPVAPQEVVDLRPLVTQYFALFNAHKWDEMAALYSENAEFKDPAMGAEPVKLSRQEVATKYTELAAMFPNVSDSVVAIYPSGNNRIVVEFVSNATSEDGMTISLPICTIFTFENGQITKDYTYYDNCGTGD